MTSPEDRSSMASVTELKSVGAVDTDLDEAVQAADAAALAAGVAVREISDLAELADVVGLYASIWGRDANPPMTLELLRAFTKAGNYVGGAFEDGRLVGACVGFFHAPSEDALHSHIAGVSRDVLGRHVGFALKLHQRAWAMLRGVSEIAWTFDPLVSRNAWFNLVKLAARPVEYLPNFYGAMARHHQRRRRLRPAARQLAAARPGRRRRVRREHLAGLGRRRARRGCGRRARHRGRRRARARRAGRDDQPGRRASGHRCDAGLRPGAGPEVAPGRPRGALRAARGRRPDRRLRPVRLVRREEGPVKLEGVELRRVSMPLVSPFRTSFGTQTARELMLLRVVTDEGEGWGECVAMADPLYSSEYNDGAADVLRRFLVPALAASGPLEADAVAKVLEPFKGHRMAKSALEMGVLDAELRAQGRSFGSALGAVHDRVPCGVSVGIMDNIPALLDAVGGYLDEGYLRIKLKIEPGWDVEPVRAVRERYGDDVLLQVDANTAYTLARRRGPRRPRPLRPAADRAAAGRGGRARPRGPREADHDAGLPGRVDRVGAVRRRGHPAGRVRDRQHQAGPGRWLPRGQDGSTTSASTPASPVWCGGMLETGLGRAANVALAALPGFTLPGDTSGSGRYYHRDITAPFVLDDGHLAVPTGPGLGVTPLEDALAEVTTSTEWLTV